MALLLGAAPVVALAGSRIRFGRADQSDARPFVVLQRVSAESNYHYQGPSGYVASRFQIDSYADTYTAAKKLARALEARLSGFKGGIIQGIFLESHRDFTAADAGNVSNLFRISIDITVHHGETP